MTTEIDYVDHLVVLLNGYKQGCNSRLTKILLGALIRDFTNGFGIEFISHAAEDALRQENSSRDDFGNNNEVKVDLHRDHFVPVAVTVQRLLEHDLDPYFHNSRQKFILRQLHEGAIVVKILADEHNKLNSTLEFKQCIPDRTTIVQTLPSFSTAWFKASTDEERGEVLRSYGPVAIMDRYRAKGIYCAALEDYLSHFFKESCFSASVPK